MYHFNSQSEDEIKKELLPSENEHEGLIVSSTLKTSREGLLMISLRIQLEEDGVIKTQFDNLLYSGKMKFKFKHACEYTGLKEDYDNNKIDPGRFLEKKVRILIAHQDHPKYGLTGYVKDYLPLNSHDSFNDDKLPF